MPNYTSREFFSSTLWHDGAQTFGAHRHSHAPSRVRAAHACSYHHLCHEHERLCPLVSHETDGPSICPGKTPRLSPSCKGTQRAHPGGPGCRRHAPAHDKQLARRKHDHDGSARRWWREVPPRPNATHSRVAKTVLRWWFLRHAMHSPMTSAG